MRAQKAWGKSLSGILFVGLAATGCTSASTVPLMTASQSTKAIAAKKVTYSYTSEDRSCLKRAMYFESVHSDHQGYMAVGTVVMNRLTSGAYPPSICGIVSQEKQFAPGVMTREVKTEAEPDLDMAADAILHGGRNPEVREAMFFHTDGLKFPYDNMHYTAVAGGNAFYEKRGADGELQTPAPLPAYEVAMTYMPVQPASATQFGILIPEAVPVPTPMPMAAATMVPDFTTNTYPEPTFTPVSDPMPAPAMVIPLPRPAIDSAALRGGFDPAGG